MERRSVQIQTGTSFLTWVVGALILAVVVVLGIFFLTFVLAGLAVAALVTPVVAWWRRKKGLPRAKGRGRVIDAEFTVSPKKAEE